MNERGSYMKMFRLGGIILLMLLFLTGCSLLADDGVNAIRKPTELEVHHIFVEFEEIFVEMVKPTFPYLLDIRGYLVLRKETDYATIIEYFRDNDFSEELSRMEALVGLIPDLDYGVLEDYASVRFSMRRRLDAAKQLIALGNRYAGREIDVSELSIEDKSMFGELHFARSSERSYEEVTRILAETWDEYDEELNSRCRVDSHKYFCVIE
jgi:hypothetical protein